MANQTVRFIIKRQPTPESRSHWQEFDLPLRPSMNVISGLMAIAENAIDRFGKATTPITYDSNCLKEACGACANQLRIVLVHPEQTCRVELAMLNQLDIARDPEDRVIDEHNERDVREKMLDKTIADTFPASDPPSSIPDPDDDSFEREPGAAGREDGTEGKTCSETSAKTNMTPEMKEGSF